MDPFRLPSDTYRCATGLTADPDEVGRSLFRSDTGWVLVGVEYHGIGKTLIYQYENDLAIRYGE